MEMRVRYAEQAERRRPVQDHHHSWRSASRDRCIVAAAFTLRLSRRADHIDCPPPQGRRKVGCADHPAWAIEAVQSAHGVQNLNGAPLCPSPGTPGEGRVRVSLEREDVLKTRKGPHPASPGLPGEEDSCSARQRRFRRMTTAELIAMTSPMLPGSGTLDTITASICVFPSCEFVPVKTARIRRLVASTGDIHRAT